MSRVEVVKDRNHLVVVGEDIDSVKLVNSLRKKFCFANIITLHNAYATTESREFEEERRVGEEERWPPRIHYEYPTRHYGQPAYYMADPFYDPNPPTPCSIMWSNSIVDFIYIFLVSCNRFFFFLRTLLVSFRRMTGENRLFIYYIHIVLDAV